MRKLTTGEFIERAKKIHGDKYDYSKVDYKNNKTKVTIICPEHGEFTKTPPDHLYGAGCPKCPRNKGLSAEEFLKKAREVHGDKHDYSKVEYNCNSTVVCIICPKHGEFFKTPKRFLSGSGCNECLEEKSKSKHKKRLTPRYWTKERCYEVAKKNNWLKDYTWLKGRFRWTEELCREEALKYTEIAKFRRYSPGCFQAATKNDWISKYTWLKKSFKWTKELYLEKAKECKDPGDLKKKFPNCYKAALRHKWSGGFRDE